MPRVVLEGWVWRLRHHQYSMRSASGQQRWLAVIAILFVVCLSPATSAEKIAELADRTGQSVVHLHIVGRRGGSPVLTHDGKVIAVAVGMVGGDSRVGFGIPIDMLHRLLATLPADAKPQPLPNAVSVWRNLLISAIAFGALGLAFAIPSLVKRLRR